jgi:MYXO-CTERM domain-containing protein
VRNGGCGYYGGNGNTGLGGAGGAAYACISPQNDYAVPDAGASRSDAAASDGGGVSLYGTNQTNTTLREEDLTTLFAHIPGANARVTRLRSDLVHSALNVDLVLQAAGDQSQLATLRQVTKEANQPQCPIYQGCTVVGTGPRDQAQAAQNGGSGGGETFGCSTSASTAEDGTVLAIGALAGLLGLAAIRIRRRSKI